MTTATTRFTSVLRRQRRHLVQDLVFAVVVSTSVGASIATLSQAIR